MPVSDARKRASAKWNASKDNIMIRPDKETGAAIRAAASAAGLSNQQYILEAVDAYMHGGNTLRLNYEAIGMHAEKNGETTPAFVNRAVRDQIERDNSLFKMGLKPKTDKTTEREAAE